MSLQGANARTPSHRRDLENGELVEALLPYAITYVLVAKKERIRAAK